ncbi:helix-turn-helix transcriptional regulator [Planobispora takensis]|uniref:Helix-turn-helix transcriptional regulator n=1 Tax=Planobispora takensis TaxID=1367882 RepID=A0A8J3WQC7_9ACTN|nr:LuxR family transcriptional regulator [Planobispora takensis]GIH98328.1 helix-turn-helix transcriptional regulator [Planobispora takensis]
MLRGRAGEQAEIDRLLAAARAGTSGVLVVRGQAGIGKSALLDYARERAEGFRVLRGTGVEPEAELPFAALHLLLRSGLDRIDALPPVQAAALRGALGLGAAAPENRFLVGLATLSMLAELAGDGSLLCLVDDAQWLDRASLDTLLFAARRLEAEGVALIFAAREGLPAAGLPELHLRGLDRTAAARLLSPDLSPDVRERIIGEAQGNPLALIELPAALTAGQRAGRLSPVEVIPVTGRVQEAFEARIRALPESAQEALLVLAADGRGTLGGLVRAGVSPADLEPAERARLITVDDAGAAFRHPLIRAAAYRNAPLARRLAAHRALARALDGEQDADRRAWHLAAATTAPDEEVAAELERAAERARTRTGHAAVAAAYERAAELTPDPAGRSARLAAAAVAAGDAGLMRRANALAAEVSGDLADPATIAHLTQARAHLEFERGTPAEAGRIIADGARRVAAGDPEKAAYLWVEAIRCAWFSGETGLAAQAEAELSGLVERALAEHVGSGTAGSGTATGTGAVAGAGVPGAVPWSGAPLPAGALGLARFVAGDVAAAVPLMTTLAEGYESAGLGVPGLLMAASLGVPLGRPDLCERLAARVVEDCRERGMVAWLTLAAQDHLVARAGLGEYGEARSELDEALGLAAELRQDHRVAHLTCVLAWLLAHQGDERGCREAAEEGLRHAGTHGLALASATGAWALGLLELSLGRARESLAHLEGVSPERAFSVAVQFAPDQVEAAVRAGRPDRAREPLERYLEWARHVRRPESDAIALRCRALVEDEEEYFARAVHGHAGAGRDAAQGDAGGEGERFARAAHGHAGGGQPYQHARTRLVYGEWLRRARRRADARTQLRAALEIFDRLGAELWAERARAELRATGDVPAAPRRDGDPLSVLTQQERRIVAMAATGASNRDIAARLFLSPRTVGYHLYKAFPKLGVSSRAELSRRLDGRLTTP